MTAGPSLHSMHSIEHEKPRSRAKRILLFLPLTVLMVAVLVLSAVGIAAKQSSKAEAAAQQKALLSRPSQQSSLADVCTSEGFPAGPADIWTGDRTAASEAVFAAHPDTAGMRVEGRDGFNFWGEAQSQNISQALGRAPWLDSQLAQWIQYFNGLNAQLHKDGRDFLIVISPAKWELYGDKLPAWTDELRGKTHLDQFLEHAGDLPVADVREAMRAAEQRGPVFSAVNTHWTPYGALSAWQQAVKCGAALYPDSVWSKISVPEVSSIAVADAPNEFTSYGAVGTTKDWAEPTLEPAGSPVESTITNPEGKAVPGPTDGSVGLLEMPAHTTSKSGTGHALIVRDSTGEALAPIWAQAFSETCQIRHMLDYPDKRPDIVTEAKKCNADVVVYVFTERYFSQMPPMLPAG